MILSHDDLHLPPTWCCSDPGSDGGCYNMIRRYIFLLYFFFQAVDGIRDAQESRGLGDVYKRQDY